jgi:hypothetical protein
MSGFFAISWCIRQCATSVSGEASASSIPPTSSSSRVAVALGHFAHQMQSSTLAGSFKGPTTSNSCESNKSNLMSQSVYTNRRYARFLNSPIPARPAVSRRIVPGSGVAVMGPFTVTEKLAFPKSKLQPAVPIPQATGSEPPIRSKKFPVYTPGVAPGAI